MTPDAEAKGQMMLDTDMCLLYMQNPRHAQCMTEFHDGKTRNAKYCNKFEKQCYECPHHEKTIFLTARNAKSCCAWMRFRRLNEREVTTRGGGKELYCGLTNPEVDGVMKMLHKANKGIPEES